MFWLAQFKSEKPEKADGARVIRVNAAFQILAMRKHIANSPASDGSHAAGYFVAGGSSYEIGISDIGNQTTAQTCHRRNLTIHKVGLA